MKGVTFLLSLVAFAILGYVLFLPVDFTGYATTDAQTGNLTVGVQTYMACTWSNPAITVDFGSSLDPGTNDINASANNMGADTGYNITVSALSTASADITISGNDLIDGANIILVENVTYQTGTTASDAAMVPSGSASINETAMEMFINKAPGTVNHYRMWIDIPSEVVAGSYQGNYTLTCAQA